MSNFGDQPDGGMPEAYPWYALRTAPCHEKGVHMLLHGGCCAAPCQSYLPLCSTPSLRRDQVKPLGRPLFPGYLFARFDWDRRTDVFRMFGLIRSSPVVMVGRKPAGITPEEIQAVRDMVALDARPWAWSAAEIAHCSPGDRIEARVGTSLVQGRILRRKGKRWIIVSLDPIGREVAIAADSVDLRAVQSVA